MKIAWKTLFFTFYISTTSCQNIWKKTFNWWIKPSVVPVISIYVYNVTNAEDFLINGSKPIVDEIGPYVYQEKWDRVNIVPYNDNGTVSYYLKKLFYFNEYLSAGSEDDVVVVPNIPLLSTTSLSKYVGKDLKLKLKSIVNILKLKSFVEVSVGQLLWGYEDPLLKLVKDVTPKDLKLPYDDFGLFYNKNGTLIDKVSIFTGIRDIAKFGLIDTYDGMSQLPHWLTDKCNSLLASDGSLFPPHVTKNTTLYLYDKEFCRTLPLVFEQEIKEKYNISSWRFSPPTNVFDTVEKNPENKCYCPEGSPCSPSGLFNISLCQYDSPMMLSFPHFYLAEEDSLRTALDGVSSPDPEKHKFYLDVQPDTGFTTSAKKRLQFNLAVSHRADIEAVAKFPDVVFPIYWFEESVDDILEDLLIAEAKEEKEVFREDPFPKLHHLHSDDK